MGKELSILMYPVAEYNLQSFINDLDPRTWLEPDWLGRLHSLESFVGCLIAAVESVHFYMTKYMDIKPQNILVRDIRRSKHDVRSSFQAFKIYIADFGISRSYDTLDATETEGPTMFTKKYAAPEVVDRQKRGLPADIFSLGCVFVEIAATLDHFTSAIDPDTRMTPKTRFNHDYALHAKLGEQDPLHKIQETLRANEYGDTSYQANIDAVCKLTRRILVDRDWAAVTHDDMLKMLRLNPSKRPSAKSLAPPFNGRLRCCISGADPLEAINE